MNANPTGRQFAGFFVLGFVGSWVLNRIGPSPTIPHGEWVTAGLLIGSCLAMLVKDRREEQNEKIKRQVETR
jgi:hypothetical protein